ncbi:hypothetical protein BVRB_6g140800 [Beta vulgaris subsp. vulgaris]|nr:hypothetical protein BVRB_6g140800 [Beta vulgaris subsp. vulgaris]
MLKLRGRRTFMQVQINGVCLDMGYFLVDVRLTRLQLMLALLGMKMKLIALMTMFKLLSSAKY